MAQIANTRKVFNFAIEIDGLQQFLVQTVQLPDVEVEEVKHGDTNHDIKTPGRVVTGDLVLEKLKESPGSDKWAWAWLNSVQDPFTGSGILPLDAKKTIVVRELDSTQTIAINSWICEGCFVKKLSQSKFDRMSSDNVMETVTLSVDRMRVI